MGAPVDGSSSLRRAASIGFVRDLFVGLGVVATLIGLVQAGVPTADAAVRWLGGLGIVGAVVVAVVRQRPRSQLVAHYAAGPWTITVAEGDVLDFSPAVVTVDRSMSLGPAEVGPTSLISQLVEREFGGNVAALAQRTGGLADAASEEPLDGGVLIRLADHSPTRFLLTCSRKGLNGSELTYGELWRVYEGAWEALRGQSVDSVALPLVGSGFSRSALPDIAVLMTLLASFHGASIERPVCKDVRIVVPNRRLTAIGAHHVRSMLEGLGYDVSTDL